MHKGHVISAPKQVCGSINMIDNTSVQRAILGSRAASASSAVRKAADKALTSISDGERQAILQEPDMAGRFGWLVTSPHFSRMRKDPYAVSVFTDDDSAASRDCVELRDWFAKTFSCESPQLPGTAASPRNHFIAWRIFQSKNNSRHIYLARTLVERDLAAAGVRDMADAFKSLVDSPKGAELVTHAEYSKMQASIRNWVRGASSVAEAALGRLDVSGLDTHQAGVAKDIVTLPFSILTGGAGTGKSTLIAAIVKALLAARTTLICLAPTHRAKKNLAKRLPASANVATVDSFVRQSSSAQGSLNTKVFIFVDESSMLDLEKTARLARMAMNNTEWQICLAGDDGQLEPIARGEMFRTAIHNAGPHVFQLTKCYRAENDGLYQAQAAIRAGKLPTPSDSFGIHLFDSDSQIEKAVVPFVKKHKDKVQFITWTNRMCDFVNILVQEQRSQGKVPAAARGSPIAGDRVVYVGLNDVRKQLTNAMLGTVKQSPQSSGESKLLVHWDDSGKDIACTRRDLLLAYCVTVHRAQGSQFPHVCVIATSIAAMTRSLDRRWAYVAASRAQQKCDVFATKGISDFIAKPVRKREMVGVNFNSSVQVKA